MDARELQILASWRDTASTPVLAPAAGYLLSTLYADDLSISAMTAQMERFPSIAARLLVVANSAWSAPLTPVTRLQDACARLGLDLVRTLSIAMAMANTFDPSKCRGFDSERYWVTALLAAEGTTRMAQGMHRADDALTWRGAALFHNMGLLWFADRYPEATSAALTSNGDEDLIARMRSTLGIDYCRSGAYLARIWRLPEVYVGIIAHHREPQEAGEHLLAAATVGVATDIASCLYRGEQWTPDRIPECIAGQLAAELADATGQHLSSVLQNTQAMGRTIAAA